MTQAASSTGAGPPTDVDAADLWTKLTTLPRPHTEVAFPRKGANGEWFTDKVAIWVLTEAELMSTRAAADAYAKELLVNPQKSGDANMGYQEVYRNACVVEVIFRACRSTKNLQLPAFPDPMRMRKFLTSDELAVLFNAYCNFQASSGPMLSLMTKEEMNAWIAVLQEGGTANPLSRLTLEGAKALLLHSVSLLPKSPTDNGSAGSPPDGFSPSTSPTSLSETAGSLSSRPGASSLVDISERPAKPQMDE